MKFVCLGYLDVESWDTLGAGEQEAMIAQCVAYDVELNKGGHFAGGEALQGAEATATVRWQDDKAMVSDGPYAETKEILGGILILEAADRAEAIRLICSHPGIRMGRFEIRPIDEAFMAEHPVLSNMQE